MSKIERFEDIEAWKRARQLTNLVYGASRVGGFSRDFALKDQIRRASISTMSNIAEGFERGGDSEFIHFLSMAKASCGETRSQLYVALDQGYLPEARFQQLVTEAEGISRLISGFMRYLQQSSLRGSKHKQIDSRH